jgi:hypothetical protein
VPARALRLDESMAALTRRRDPNSHEETWHILYGGLRVGTIGQGAGNPLGTDPWFWQCGFYPGSNPGDESHSTAESFEAARTAFEAAWRIFLSKRTAADFLEYRHFRASTAWRYAMTDAGCKVPTEVADGHSHCFCGAAIGITDMDEHIYAAHMETH